MTLTEARAVNEIADEVVTLAKKGVAITPALKHGVSILLINAEKVLQAAAATPDSHFGYDPASFFVELKISEGS